MVTDLADNTIVISEKYANDKPSTCNRKIFALNDQINQNHQNNAISQDLISF